MPDMATKLNKIISDPEWNLYNASRAEVSDLLLFLAALAALHLTLVTK